MASADHAHNLTMVLPAIERLLDRTPRCGVRTVRVDPDPGELERFGNRVTTAPPVTDYAQFPPRICGARMGYRHLPARADRIQFDEGQHQVGRI